MLEIIGILPTNIAVFAVMYVLCELVDVILYSIPVICTAMQCHVAVLGVDLLKIYMNEIRLVRTVLPSFIHLAIF